MRRGLDRLTPKPWPVERESALESLQALDLPQATRIVWLSDGLTQGSGGNASFDDSAFMALLAELGDVTLVRDGGGQLARMLLPPEDDGRALVLSGRRADAAGSDRAAVLAQDEDGRAVGRAELDFADGAEGASARLELPAELRNRIARLVIEGEASAGAVQLLDERWRRRPVGMIDLRPAGSAQPLLSELYYLERALAPFTELRRGSVEELLQRELAVMVLTDADRPNARTLQRLGSWVESGGLLLRFAGPRLVESGDDLLPVRLRVGDRQLGGALTWDTPARLASFDAGSPFAGLRIPGDVTVERQVLAEPALDLADKTWARLADGTPLVTAEKRGDGWIVLMHITANNDWSNLRFPVCSSRCCGELSASAKASRRRTARPGPCRRWKRSTASASSAHRPPPSWRSRGLTCATAWSMPNTRRDTTGGKTAGRRTIWQAPTRHCWCCPIRRPASTSRSTPAARRWISSRGCSPPLCCSV